ncbi:MAG: HEAT repeat domain-containing protein [Planctomycetaceae bacterium]
MTDLFHRTRVISLFAVTLTGFATGCSDDNATTNIPAAVPINKQSVTRGTGTAKNPERLAPRQAPNPIDRIQQIHRLEKQAQDDPEAKTEILTELRGLAADSDIRIREAAAKALATAGECSEESLRLLLAGLSRPIGGNSFAVPLNKLGEPALPGVLNALKSEDAITRKKAAFCLGLTWCVAQARERVSALSSVAEKDADPMVRHQATVSMAILARHDEVDTEVKGLVVPTLTRALKDTSRTADNRRHLIAVIGGMGHKAHPLIPSMISQLEDEDAATRARAADALGMLASPYRVKRGQVVVDSDLPDYRASSESTELAVAALIPALSDEDSEVRAKAAIGLSHIGPAAAAAIPALTLQLKEEETEPRLRAAEALVKVAADPSAAIPILKAAAESKSPETRDRWWKTRTERLLKEINSTKAGRGDNE